LSKETKGRILGVVLLPVAIGMTIISLGMHFRADWTPWFLGLFSVVVATLSLGVFIYTRVKKWRFKKKLKQYMKEMEHQKKLEFMQQRNKDEKEDQS